MTIIEAMTQDLRDDGTITRLRHWTKGEHERTYIQVAGYNPSYRGCRSHQLYWDHKARKLVSEHRKGTTPHAYDNAVGKVVNAFAATD